MEPVETAALGIELFLVATDDGGRRTGLLGGHGPEHRLTYRPNWGLPGWADGAQTGAPVLAFDRVDMQPGETVHAVIVPMLPSHVPAWSHIAPGDALRMYEGSRVCGRATVRWIEPTTWPVSDVDQERLVELLRREG